MCMCVRMCTLTVLLSFVELKLDLKQAVRMRVFVLGVCVLAGYVLECMYV